jgi:hypothetical protein
MKKECDIYSVYAAFQRVPEIMGLELTLRRNAWEGQYYIGGEKHRSKRDKLKVKIWTYEEGSEIVVYEQGGESMGLPKWLCTYGGCNTRQEAIARLRGESGFRFQYVRRETKVKEVKYVPQELVEEYGKVELERCPLFQWMCGLFGKERTTEVWRKYGVQSDRYGRAVFWYIDAEDRVCHDKVISYLTDGHRDKNSGCKRAFKVGDGYSGECLFGANLTVGKDEVFVLESEKSCLLAAAEYPERVFVATGGKGNVRLAKGARFKLLPDMDAVEEWQKKGEVVRWWQGAGCEVGEKWDLGDLIVWKKERNVSAAEK